ncbi:MAG: hypothetical protein IPL59_17705 [Candidatus Competibacteraceae bacterium]|nr:hypothetical protein [Candidatus Competibacteraceae bacterium]
MAAAVALRAVVIGSTVALTAPTELLAEQHYRNFRDWLQPLGIEVAWLTDDSPVERGGPCWNDSAAGETHVAVGTHALFQETVTFGQPRAGDCDEQHRFGVHQRLALRRRAGSAALPASAHHDRYPDPAHSGDERLRDPGH